MRHRGAGLGQAVADEEPQTVQLKSAKPSAGVRLCTSVSVELAGVVQSTWNSRMSRLSVGGLPK